MPRAVSHVAAVIVDSEFVRQEVLATFSVDPARGLIRTAEEEIECEAIAGCDGFHGVCRGAVPLEREWEREYPFGWLGILAEVAPAGHRGRK